MSKLVPNLGPPGPPLIRPDLVHRHLEKVLLSAEMCRSKKLCQFLRFTVDEVLRGHGSELKEYAIGVGVFRRGREFDPATDPIVRVQARRLRAKLEHYYQGEGREEAIQIEYPVGGYSPVFVRRVRPQDDTAPGKEATAASENKVGMPLAVLPFADLGPEDSQCFSDGLTDELIHTFSNVPGVRAVARASCYQFKGKSEDVRRIGEWLGARALICGSVRREGTRVRVLAQLIDAQSGLNVWSAGYQWELGGMLETQAKISQEVSGIIMLQLANWAGQGSPTPMS